MHRSIVAFLTILALTGCAVQQPSRGLRSPAPGFAKVYVLRPAFSTVSKNESPTLYINNREAARLQIGSYSDFILRPGTYKLAVKPRRSESDVWTGEWEMSVQSDQKYFLAIWNETEHREELKGWYVGLPMPYLVTVRQNKSLHYELVAEQDALPVIPTLTYIAPLSTDFVPLP